MNLSAASRAVLALAKPATLRRFGARQRNPNGTFSDPVATEIPIQAVIQAPSEGDLRQVPEGERSEAWVTIWTPTELHTASEDSGALADEIESPRGERFKVYRVAVREEGGFTRAIGRLTHDRGRRV
ncbi:hypothetical protein ABEG18_13050 [Alsobacter sp. KACC 23698]|uniref:Head-tail adaptor protein n=1 Tax=Alsobacter sp. KACC 23698 TaxID=3149229 RepID=A0AAU7JNI6_9HYPH